MSRPFLHSFVRSVVMLLLAALLAGCGDDGSSSASDPDPVVPQVLNGPSSGGSISESESFRTRIVLSGPL